MISIHSKDLSRSLQFIGGGIPTRPALPILGSVLLKSLDGVLYMQSTDLEMFLSANVEVDSEITPIDVCIPYKRFIDLINKIDGDVRISVKDDYIINIDTSNGKYKIHGYSSKDFPQQPSDPMPVSFNTSGDLLSGWLKHVIYATSSDDLRPAMTGVLFTHDGGERLKLVATDGHRLSEVELLAGASQKFDVIIPNKSASTVAKIIEDNVDISIGEGYASFMYDSGKTVITRTINEAYPKYEAVIPAKKDSTAMYQINRDELRESLERLLSFTNQTTKMVKAEFTATKLTLTGEDLDLSAEGKDYLTIQGSGEDTVIGFNANYMIENLKHLNEEVFWVYLSGSNRAILIQNDVQRLLLMPVMLNHYGA
jgi:DNA polymerase-3 subunit beta